jgi:SAM-dependent methyltransferase
MSGRDRVRRIVPVGARLAVARALGRQVSPPPGRVDFGDLRRTAPIAGDFGYGRGGPVDRHYIEAFLDRHRADIRGRVLEIGDAAYTRAFGGPDVTRPDVLHVDDSAPEATFVGDLADGSFLPGDAFDCIVLTQTLHLVFDFRAALATVARVLRPGGVLLLTVPGISNVAGDEWGATWHYSFTQHALARAAEEAFAGWSTEISSHGNVLAAVAFLHGLGRQELTAAELSVTHAEYALVHTLRVVKPGPPGDRVR